MIERLLEDRMTPQEAARFESLVCQNRSVCRLYLLTMNMVSNLPQYVASHEWILGDDPDPLAPDTRHSDKPSMEEAMVLPALREQDLFDDEPPPMRMFDRPAARPPQRPTRWSHWVTGAAAAIVVGVLVGWGFYGRTAQPLVVVKPLPPQPAVVPPASEPAKVVPKKVVRLTGTAGISWTNGAALRPGTVLEPGRTIAFDAGAAEVLFGDGVRVVVEGPAAFDVVDAKNANLAYGKLVARVPPAGRGFAVQFGDRKVTDLGTEFGLAADVEHGATVAVFDGQVVLDQAATPNAQPSTRPAAPLRLTRGEAVASTEANQSWSPVAATAVAFARTLANVRVPIPSLPTTGLGLQDGQPDPDWVVFNDAAGEATAKPAYMTTTGPPSSVFWAANDPSRSQWLSLAGNLPRVEPGVFVFRTTIDLTGFDPATVAIEVDFMVDDALNDVRINGTSVGADTESIGLKLPMTGGRPNWRQFHRVTLRKGFSAGRNTIDLVVYNGGGPSGRAPNMGLRAELHGQGVPVPVR